MPVKRKFRWKPPPTTYLWFMHKVKHIYTTLVSQLLPVHLWQQHVGGRGATQHRAASARMVTTRSRATKRLQEAESLQHVAQRLKSLPQREYAPISKRCAAVLVALFEDANGVANVWLTQRSSALSSHAGEVCLPGGKRDPTDESDAHTALREAQEELGLEPSSVQVLCTLPPFLSKHLLSVAPVVAQVPASFTPVPNPDEVAHVFHMPLSAFLDSSKHIHYDMKTATGGKYRVHSFEHGGFIVWGLTSAMMIKVAQLALDRAPDFAEDAPNSMSLGDMVATSDGKGMQRREGDWLQLATGRVDVCGEAAAGALGTAPAAGASLPQ